MHGPRPWVSLLLSLTCACGNPTEDQLGYAALLGDWSLQLTDTAGCAALASAPPAIDFSIAQTAADTGQGFLGWSLNLEHGTSTWHSGPLHGWMGGSLTQYPPGPVDLHFVTGVYNPSMPDSSARVIQFIGTLSGQLSLAGTLYDPPLWLVGVQAPLLSPAPCAYRARGGHQ